MGMYIGHLSFLWTLRGQRDKYLAHLISRGSFFVIGCAALTLKPSNEESLGPVLYLCAGERKVNNLERV